MPRTINLHADELEYTSEGLKADAGIDLEVGAHNRIVIRRPKPVEAIPVGLGGFASDSSFPTPVALAALIGPSLLPLLGIDDKRIYQVYGHASADGSESHNKDVSDRRAKVFTAFLVGDVDTVLDVAGQERWGVEAQQVMLRVLRCDPGVIDGDAGELTRMAVTNFQEDYNDGVFHVRTDRSPTHAPLPVDGELGSAADALVEAYVLAVSPFVDPGNLHPSHPTIGCSEFNPVAENAGALDRRVSLVVHESVPAFSERAPCKEGDASVCPVDDAPRRCLWYRAHVIDPTPDGPHAHVDPRWLPLPNGNVLLTALTTLPDDSDVTFQVYRAHPIGGPEDIVEACLDEPLSEGLSGIVRSGVAQVVWAPPQDYDPFDFDDWFPVHDVATLTEDPGLVFRDQPRVRPPLFRVEGGGATTLSEPPGQDLRRLRLQLEDGSSATEAKTAWGYDSYGRALQVDLDGRRMKSDERAIEERHRVMHLEPFGYLPLRKDES